MRASALLATIIALVGIRGPAAVAEPSATVTPDDSFFGTWTLDLSRSHYAREIPPEQMTIVIGPAPNGLAYRSNARYVGGRRSSSLYTASFDGTAALVVGTTGFLAPVSLHLLDAATIEATYSSGLKEIAWSRWSVNAKRTELFVTTTYFDEQGEQRQNVAAFHRMSF